MSEMSNSTFIKLWVFRKLGIYDFIWEHFCKEYPIRLSGETPEVKKYLETQEKVITDMIVYGMGCTQYVDPKTINSSLEDVVKH